MKKKFIYIGLASVLSIVVVMGTLLFGTHIGKTVTEKEMKNLDNEIAYNLKDIEGVWLAKHTTQVDEELHMSYRLVKLSNLEEDMYQIEEDILLKVNSEDNNITETDVEKIFDDSKRRWSEQWIFGEAEYGSKTRTFDTFFVPIGVSEVGEAYSSIISVGKDAEYLSMSLPNDTERKPLYQNYTMIKIPESTPENYNEINTEQELGLYLESLFKF